MKADDQRRKKSASQQLLVVYVAFVIIIVFIFGFFVEFILNSRGVRSFGDKHPGEEGLLHALVGNGDLLHKWSAQTNLSKGVEIALYKMDNHYKVSVTIDQPCSATMRTVLFNESVIQLLNKVRVGPDEILVYMEGPTVQVEIASSQNYCNIYQAYMQIPLSGRYRIKVVRLRKNYAAVSEDDSVSARINYETFIDALVPMQLNMLIPSPCMSISIFEGKYPLNAVNGYWVSSSTPLLQKPVEISSKCRSEKAEEIIPRGVSGLTSYVKMSSDFGEEEQCVSEIDVYKWNRHICAYRKKTSLIHDSDVVADFVDTKNPAKIVLTSENNDFSSYNGKSKAILFVGGIHMRGLLSIFLSEVCKYQGPQRHIDHNILRVQFIELSKAAADRHRLMHEKECKEDKSKCELFDSGCEGLTVGYLGGDSSCRPEMTVHFSQFNYVVVNCGSYQSFSYQDHRESLTKFLDAALSAKLKFSNQLYWVESSAPILRNEVNDLGKKDKRTYHRMLVYHQILQEEVVRKKLQNHITLVPAFQSTLALSDKLCDCVAFPASVLMPQLISLLDAIRKTNHRIAHQKSLEIFHKQPL